MASVFLDACFFRQRLAPRLLVAAMIVALSLAGCGKKAANPPVPTPTSAVATSTPNPPTAASHAPTAAVVPANPQLQTARPGADVEATLARLTTELRRYVAFTRMPPKTFEEFIAHDPIMFPPPPAGKKYVIAQGKVVLK